MCMRNFSFLVQIVSELIESSGTAFIHVFYFVIKLYFHVKILLPTNQQIFLHVLGLAARQKAKLFDYFQRPNFYIQKILCIVKFCGLKKLFQFKLCCHKFWAVELFQRQVDLYFHGRVGPARRLLDNSALRAFFRISRPFGPPFGLVGPAGCLSYKSAQWVSSRISRPCGPTFG